MYNVDLAIWGSLAGAVVMQVASYLATIPSIKITWYLQI